MDKKYFKRLSRSLPSIGMGTWRLGSHGDKPIKVLRSGFSQGLTMVDTAEAYAFGYSETLVGEAIKGVPRDDLFIVSKVMPTRRRTEILDSAQSSVKRLGTYIDLYLLHNPDIAEGTLAERMQGLEDVVEKGYARSIGVSNFRVDQIEEAQSCLSRLEIAAVQNRLNLYDRHWLDDVVPYCQREDLMFMAYSPLDTGRLANDRGALLALSEKLGKTRLQVGLNWLNYLDNVVSIPKLGKLSHLEECLGALGWNLSGEDWKRLLNDYADYDGYENFNMCVARENLRYYFTPHFFTKYARYYRDPRHFAAYVQGTRWKRRHHL